MGSCVRPVTGWLLAVAACSGQAAVGDRTPAGDDAGNGGVSADAGADPSAEASTLVANSGASVSGASGILLGASLAGDSGPSTGMPPRLGDGASWTNAVPGGLPQVLTGGG